MLLEVAAVALANPQLNGTRVRPEKACYTMNLAGKPFGTASQHVRVVKAKDGDRLEITTRQKGATPRGSFDMEDVYVVRRKDLRPISYRNIVGGNTQVELNYGDRQISGTRQVNGSPEAVSQSVTGPIWDGNLYGPIMAALPLKSGGSYRIPAFQYATGLGSLNFSVLGEEEVDTPGGRERAWVVEAYSDPARRARYHISKKTGRELGFLAGPMSQSLSNCPP